VARTRVARAVREELMLEAAEDIFGSAGFRGASMDEIAARSGITKAMLYQYFDSKEALYDACTERVRSRLFDELETRLHDVAEGRRARACSSTPTSPSSPSTAASRGCCTPRRRSAQPTRCAS
jgi:AcrR family transcriptional regulator